MAITLYTNHFQHANASRQAEIDDCIWRNISNSSIDRVVVLGQSGMQRSFTSPKVLWIDEDYSPNPHGRPTFRNYFDLVERYVEQSDDFSIVANSDIFYDDSLNLLKSVDCDGVGIALTRWELRDGGPVIMAADCSQDTWIFQGRIHPLGAVDFPMGIVRCDNRLAWELSHAGYRVVNPCHDLRSYHLHFSNVRDNGIPLRGPIQYVRRCTWRECHFPPARREN